MVVLASQQYIVNNIVLDVVSSADVRTLTVNDCALLINTVTMSSFFCIMSLDRSYQIFGEAVMA